MEMEFVMGLNKYLMAAAVASMSVAPALAAPATDAVRASSVASDSEELGGGSTILALLAAAAIIAGIILIASNDDNSPASP